MMEGKAYKLRGSHTEEVTILGYVSLENFDTWSYYSLTALQFDGGHDILCLFQTFSCAIK